MKTPNIIRCFRHRPQRIKLKSFMIAAAIIALIPLTTVSTNAYKIERNDSNTHYVSGLKNGYMVFRSWNGFVQNTRWAIDYSANQWNNKTGQTRLYHSATQHSSTTPAESPDGQNLIYKYALSTLYEPKTLMKTTFYTQIISNKCHIAEADIIVNSLKPWNNTGGPNHYDVQNVMTHELGHMLGLDDEKTVGYEASTMWYKVSLGETAKRTLEADDIAGFHAIYG